MTGQPKDYFEAPDTDTDFDDAWDPTGYYRRKEERAAEVLPYLAALFLLAFAMVVASLVWNLRENLMTWIIIAFLAGLAVAWNFPQPLFAQRAENWIRSKLGLETKTLRQ